MAYFLKNPDFVAFIHQLVDLHVLVVEGRDDGEEGEIIRDKVDNLTSFSDEEKLELQCISEFLYKIKLS